MSNSNFQLYKEILGTKDQINEYQFGISKSVIVSLVFN